MTDRSAPLRGTLPCPFCSAPGEYSHAEEVAEDVWTVICEACGANGPLDLNKANTPSRAVTAWDWRPDPQSEIRDPR
jgi:transcription elongation factor Elf1